MKIDLIELINFRNYKQQRFDFSPKLNLIIGPNGSGKTNILEALYLMAATKSWRAQDKQLIKYGKKFFRISIEAPSLSISIGYTISDQAQKVVKVFDKTVSPQKYIGQVKAVLFEPASLGIVDGSPHVRRQWLNQTLSIADQNYLEALLKYRHNLKQRNALLKQSSNKSNSEVADQVFVWNLGLVESAAKIIDSRVKFLNFLNAEINNYYRRLSNKNQEINFSYYSQTPLKDYASALLNQLNSRLQIDIRYKHTTTGAHRDDVLITFGSNPAATKASRGEIRTIALAAKLLEAKWQAAQSGGEKPILLFDDIFSELDLKRREFSLKQLRGHQIFITAADISGLKTKLPKEHKIIKLKA